MGELKAMAGYRNDAPSNVKRRVMPTRPTNAEIRTREYLTEVEVDRMIEAIGKSSRYPTRDKALLLMMYRHGLRASEAAGLRWEQVDFEQGQLHVRRMKGGVDSVHPLQGKSIRLLRKLRRESAQSPHVFLTERGGPMTRETVLRIVRRAGELAELPFSTHPHMLRHGTGYKLANDGVDTRAIQSYLGHRSIQHTVRYTELAAGRFANLWRD